MFVRRLVLIFALFGLHSVWAAGFDSLSFRPAAGKTNHFSVWSPRLLDRYQVSAGTFLTYQQTSLQVLQNGSVVQEILGQSAIQHFFVSLGLHEKWMEISAELPMVWSVEYSDPSLVNPPKENKRTSSDARIYWKANLIDRSFKLSAMPFLVLPTGSNDVFLGSESVSGGIYFLGEQKFANRFTITGNVAAYFREKYRFRNITQTHQIYYGLGGSFEFIKEFYLNAEVSGKTRMLEPFSHKVDNPIEFIAGVHFLSPSEAIRVDLGGGAGLIRGASVPEFRLLLGFVYRG